MWDPKQYAKFEKERDQPFFDLLDLIQPMPAMNIVDLGCGTGKLTQALHQKLRAAKTLGIDHSNEMLAESKNFQQNNLSFQQMDISSLKLTEEVDLIFSNAALHWLPNHQQLFQKLAVFLKPGGQLAVQMPMNWDYPSHRIARQLASEDPFKEYLEKGTAPSVLPIEEYAGMLHQLGFKSQIVRLQVYAHTLDSTEGVIEWVKGSLLSYYRKHLPEDMYALFFDSYRERVLQQLGNSKPFFYPFKRLLLWAQK